MIGWFTDVAVIRSVIAALVVGTAACGSGAVAGRPGGLTIHPGNGVEVVAVLSRAQARTLIESAVASLLDPRQDAESLDRYFAPDYVQDVDGKRLDYAGFIQHARVLKKSLRWGRATIENLIVEGNTIADIHRIDAEKTNGDLIRVKVIAFFVVRDGKIVRVDELTHLLHGTDEDRDMGSRTSIGEQ